MPHAGLLRAPARRRVTFGLGGLAFAALLPLFFQFFQYLSDVPALWALGKASPILLAPLALLGVLRLRLPYVPLTLVILGYVLLVAPVNSMLHLQNNLLEGIGTTVKVWSFSFYFAAAFALHALHVSEASLTRALLIFAALNFVILWLIWVLVPSEAYSNIGAGILHLSDDRGLRVQLPMAFGVLGMFWLSRRFAQRPALWPVLLIILGFALMLTIFKQRTIIAGVLLLVLWGMTAGLRRRAPTIFWGLAIGGGALLAAFLPLLSSVLAGPSLRDSLGGSLSVRENSVQILLEFLGGNPLRWVFGVGGSTEFSQFSIQHILRSQNFFFADLGWLGIIGEYGVVGAVPIALFYLAALRETRRAALLSSTPMRLALRDFVVYLLITSVILSLVFTPGHVATVLAIAVYLQTLTPRAAGLPSGLRNTWERGDHHRR